LRAGLLGRVKPLREQLESAVFEAAERERAAWHELEQAIRPRHVDETLLQVCRERWQAASQSLVAALQNLKR
jgi:hypothetical protein